MHGKSHELGIGLVNKIKKQLGLKQARNEIDMLKYSAILAKDVTAPCSLRSLTYRRL